MSSVIRLNVVMLIVVTPTQLEPPMVGFKTCVKVTVSDKPSSLIQCGFICVCKSYMVQVIKLFTVI